MPPHFIFEMNRVPKKYGEKTVLQDISLMFYYGAKIGISTNKFHFCGLCGVYAVYGNGQVRE